MKTYKLITVKNAGYGWSYIITLNGEVVTDSSAFGTEYIAFATARNLILEFIIDDLNSNDNIKIIQQREGVSNK